MQAIYSVYKKQGTLPKAHVMTVKICSLYIVEVSEGIRATSSLDSAESFFRISFGLATVPFRQVSIEALSLL